jgi:hypothetical protein
MLGLLAALAAVNTGCFPRIRQCIANRWHANHPYWGSGCCSPAFKVPAGYPVAQGPFGCSSCGDAGTASMSAPIIYPSSPGIVQPPAGTPTIGNPMPLLGTEHIPSTMPPKQ